MKLKKQKDELKLTRNKIGVPEPPVRPPMPPVEAPKQMTYNELQEAYEDLGEAYEKLQVTLFQARLDNINKVHEKGKKRYIYCENVLWNIISESDSLGDYLIYEDEVVED